MFDPLSQEQPWSEEVSTNTPPPITIRQPSFSSPPPTPDKGPTPGLYGREPQIYGQPEAGLISPRETVGSNGTSFEKPEPYLRVRITGLDRNRRDILIKFDAQTNLPNFTGTTYRNVSRSYFEIQQLYESLVHSNPHTIVPALPLAQTSAPTDEEDDRLVRIMLQRWTTRISEDPILLHDEDLRSFIESDFGYTPTPRQKRKAGSSGFALIRRQVPDEDEELSRARFELTKLEGQFFDTAKAVDKLAGVRKSLAMAHSEMGNKLVNVATTESHPPLGNAFRKIGRAWHSLADLDTAQALSECVILGDSLGYQGMNARSAKETLQMRTAVLEEYQAAAKTSISKRRNIERLKASSNISAQRVDEAIEDMEEATKYEQTLARRAEGISQNLHRALDVHNRHANDDITTALIEHARSSIMYERQLLKELEALRTDVANANAKVLPSANGAPRPTVIPPLEDFNRPPPQSAPVENGSRRQTPQPESQQQQQRPPFGATQSYADPLGQAPIVSGPLGGPQQPFGQRQEPMSAPATRQAHIPPAIHTLSGRSSPVPPSSPLSLPPQSPGAGPSTPSTPTRAQTLPSSEPVVDGPPLGGRFDGTKSMFIKPTSSPSPLNPSSPLHASFTASSLGDPLTGGGGVSRVASTGVASPLHQSTSFGGAGAVDPLTGQRVGAGMGGLSGSATVRIQPTRSRLDAKEAASKLANMF